MVIVGIDPGISQPGAAAVRRLGSGERFPYRVLAARSVKTDTKAGLVDRVFEIWDLYSGLVREFCPELLAVERQADVMAAARRGAVGFNSSNHQTMATVGAAIGVARAYCLPCIEIGKRTINSAVANKGNAEKHEIQRAVELLTGERISQAKADAVAAAIAGGKRWQLEQHRRTA